MSLCPNSYNNIVISEYRKQSMANTIYQKLQNPDVIPMEYTSIRNIINQYAKSTDGYAVLYSMLELVHPALQTDAVILPPKSHECDEDIRLYAQKFDAWLRYETYANRPFSPREQVNHFIRELSSAFNPAVSRIRRLLDAWNPFDTTVPEVLKITSLPNTIERYMMEETGTSLPQIRRMRDGKFAKRLPAKLQTDNPKQDIVDKYCNFCGQHGHISMNCEFMAKLLIANESLAKVDTKSKKELQDNYKNEQRKCREKRLKKQTNIIRKLLDTGGSREDIEAVLANINGDEDMESVNSDTNEQDDNTDSGSE
jgi:hypothetical protein